jgi:hypothetical protein
MTISKPEWTSMSDAEPTAERYRRMGYKCTIQEFCSERAGSFVRIIAEPMRSDIWDAVP